MSVICNYCGKPASLVRCTSFHLRPEHALVWRCEPCNAQIGTDGHTGQPTGKLAKPELLAMRMEVHRHFEALWRPTKLDEPALKGRVEARVWLANVLKIPTEECHVGLFDEELCKRALDALLA